MRHNVNLKGGVAHRKVPLIKKLSRDVLRNFETPGHFSSRHIGMARKTPGTTSLNAGSARAGSQPKTVPWLVKYWPV
jgi:hypothetical protein